MFTGIITDIGEISTLTNGGNQLRIIRINSAYDADSIDIGASIACSGPCLTVTNKGHRASGCWFEVTAAQETLARTTVTNWQEGELVNLERSLKIGDELGGHLVSGHVDGTAKIIQREDLTGKDTPWGATARFHLQAPDELAHFIAEKGSVTLDGVSLTVNSVNDAIFSVLLIPHTLEFTIWGRRQANDWVNIEVDLMARYAARLSEKALSPDKSLHMMR